MADTLTPGGILMRIGPMRLHGWVSLCNTAVSSWLDDRAPSMGAAIAYYTVFSLAPMLVMVIAVAGLAFGQQAAEGALFGELADLVGPESAAAVQAMLRSASGTWSGIFALITACVGARSENPEVVKAMDYEARELAELTAAD
jgi:membrane protein